MFKRHCRYAKTVTLFFYGPSESDDHGSGFFDFIPRPCSSRVQLPIITVPINRPEFPALGVPRFSYTRHVNQAGKQTSLPLTPRVSPRGNPAKIIHSRPSNFYINKPWKEPPGYSERVEPQFRQRRRVDAGLPYTHGCFSVAKRTQPYFLLLMPVEILYPSAEHGPNQRVQSRASNGPFRRNLVCIVIMLLTCFGALQVIRAT